MADAEKTLSINFVANLDEVKRDLRQFQADVESSPIRISADALFGGSAGGGRSRFEAPAEKASRFLAGDAGGEITEAALGPSLRPMRGDAPDISFGEPRPTWMNLQDSVGQPVFAPRQLPAEAMLEGEVVRAGWRDAGGGGGALPPDRVAAAAGGFDDELPPRGRVNPVANLMMREEQFGAGGGGSLPPRPGQGGFHDDDEGDDTSPAARSVGRGGVRGIGGLFIGMELMRGVGGISEADEKLHRALATGTTNPRTLYTAYNDYAENAAGAMPFGLGRIGLGISRWMAGSDAADSMMAGSEIEDRYADSVQRQATYERQLNERMGVAEARPGIDREIKEAAAKRDEELQKNREMYADLHARRSAETDWERADLEARRHEAWRKYHVDDDQVGMKMGGVRIGLSDEGVALVRAQADAEIGYSGRLGAINAADAAAGLKIDADRGRSVADIEKTYQADTGWSQAERNYQVDHDIARFNALASASRLTAANMSFEGSLSRIWNDGAANAAAATHANAPEELPSIARDTVGQIVATVSEELRRDQGVNADNAASVNEGRATLTGDDRMAGILRIRAERDRQIREAGGGIRGWLLDAGINARSAMEEQLFTKQYDDQQRISDQRMGWDVDITGDEARGLRTSARAKSIAADAFDQAQEYWQRGGPGDFERAREQFRIGANKEQGLLRDLQLEELRGGHGVGGIAPGGIVGFRSTYSTEMEKDFAAGRAEAQNQLQNLQGAIGGKANDTIVKGLAAVEAAVKDIKALMQHMMGGH